MKAELRFVFGCGGTGGHIFPGIAVANELRRQNCEILFIGNRGGLEESLVASEGYPFRGIRMRKLYRKVSLDNLLFPVTLVMSVLASRKIMRGYRPHGVVCTGGFVSGPVAIAAVLCKIPLFFHESNSYPGLATRYLSRFARITFTAFFQTASYLKKTRVQRLGIPLPERTTPSPPPDLQELGLEPGLPVLLVTGGSQGSQAINNVIDAAMPRLLNMGLQVIWQTGNTGYAVFAKRHANRKGVHVFSFSPQLAEFYRLAKVAVTRAGAMTLAELEANRLPAVLVPLPTAAENHQHFNAQEQQSRGLACLLPQKDLNPDSLIAALNSILQNFAAYQAKLELPPNHAAQDIADTILANLSKEHQHAG